MAPTSRHFDANRRVDLGDVVESALNALYFWNPHVRRVANTLIEDCELPAQTIARRWAK